MPSDLIRKCLTFYTGRFANKIKTFQRYGKFHMQSGLRSVWKIGHQLRCKIRWYCKLTLKDSAHRKNIAHHWPGGQPRDNDVIRG